MACYRSFARETRNYEQSVVKREKQQQRLLIVFRTSLVKNTYDHAQPIFLQEERTIIIMLRDRYRTGRRFPAGEKELSATASRGPFLVHCGNLSRRASLRTVVPGNRARVPPHRMFLRGPGAAPPNTAFEFCCSRCRRYRRRVVRGRARSGRILPC